MRCAYSFIRLFGQEPRVHTTFASRGFSVAAPSVWNSLPVDIRACSSPHTFRRLVFLKPTALIRPSVPPSGSHKRLRFDLWWTLRTHKDLFTYFTDLLKDTQYNCTEKEHNRLKHRVPGGVLGRGSASSPVIFSSLGLEMRVLEHFQTFSPI